jgi:hypothetical protein
MRIVALEPLQDGQGTAQPITCIHRRQRNTPESLRPAGLVLGDPIRAGRRGVVLLRAQLRDPCADVRTPACCMRSPAAASDMLNSPGAYHQLAVAVLCWEATADALLFVLTLTRQPCSTARWE